MAKRRRESPGEPNALGWERVHRIFGDPRRPHEVWERQFDYCDTELRRLARTPYDEIDFGDLWYYFHDLAYVELQPDLFAYLFSVCLMDWHRSLMANEPCSRGDSEFHYGLRRGEILDRMLTPGQRDEVFDFFRDGFLARLDAERGFVRPSGETSAYGWMSRFNSLGVVMPGIDRLWEPWWSCATPGRAVAALQYCSGLMYFEGENPLFDTPTRGRAGGGPCLWENDSFIYDAGWLPENLSFLRATLTADLVSGKVAEAAARLKGEPEEEAARRLEQDLPGNRELLEMRVEELPDLLGRFGAGSCGWSV